MSRSTRKSPTGMTAEQLSARAKKGAATRRAKRESEMDSLFPKAPIDSATKLFGKVDAMANASVTINVPAELLTKVEKRLNDLGTGGSIEDLIRLSLRGFARARRVYGLLDEIEFGKYRGELVGTLIRTLPDYVSFLIENVDTFKLDAEAARLFEDVVTKI